MTAVKTGLLWLLCALDVALGVWHAHVFVSAVQASSAARAVTLENAGYILMTALFFIGPALCWHLRARISFAARLVLAALPIALFVALGGRLWLRW